MGDGTKKPFFSLTFGAMSGLFVGAAVWAGLAFGLKAIFGDMSWLGRVFSSGINGVSFAAFGAAVGQLLQRRRQIAKEIAGMNVMLLAAVDDETLLLPDDVKTARKQLRELPEARRRRIPLRLLTIGLLRARANWSATDVSEAISAEADLIQEEISAGYSNIRYLAWAIPSIGFIGTVLGIGEAMGALKFGGSDKGDPLTFAAGYLNMAFDTTFVALVLSLILMFLLHRIEAQDERMLTRIRGWCVRRLPLRMHIPKEA